MEVGEEANSEVGGSSRKEEYERVVLTRSRMLHRGLLPAADHAASVAMEAVERGWNEEVDLMTDYAPWYALGNVCIGSESYPSSLIFLHNTQLPLPLLRSTYLRLCSIPSCGKNSCTFRICTPLKPI